MKKLGILLLLCSVVSFTMAQNSNCFIIGSSTGTVKNIQGIPTRIAKLPLTEIWHFGKSSISFENGIVIGYDNSGNNLKVCKEVKKEESFEDFLISIGDLFPERSKSTASSAETKTWILSKLNGYISDEIYMSSTPRSISEEYGLESFVASESGYYIKDTKFTFEDDYLVVRNSEGKTTQQYKIPIWDLSNVSRYEDKLSIKTKTTSIISITQGKVQTQKKNYFSIRYNFGNELDLEKRLTSAFAHLMRFYKRPTANELF